MIVISVVFIQMGMHLYLPPGNIYFHNISSYYFLLFQGMPNSSPPSWLRRVCSRLLSQRLLKPHGVLHVVQGMLQGSGSKY